MKIKNKKISLAVCSLLAMASIVGGAYSVSAVQDVVAESAVAEYVATDVATKSSWETAGYGTDGYLLLGSNSSSAKLAYSDMYTEQGNDGKTEITLYNHGNNYMYYEEKDKTTDATAPISNWVLTGRRTWTVSSASYAYPYIPGTTTQYPVRLHNGFDCPYKDIGLGFSLRETEKTYVSVYVMEWNNAVSETKPITVGLYNGIKTTTVFDTDGVDSVDAHYGTALAETTVTTNGAYVTFAIEEAGDYQIVAYYDNQDPTTVTTAPVQAMMTSLFFDEEQPAVKAKLFGTDTDTKSDWESGGYGTDGYLLLGSNSSSAKLAYSDMYQEQGNDGKTEITLYNHGNNYIYYEEKDKTTDATAPISNWVLTGRRTWTVSSASYAYPYIPGTTTQYPVRLHNGFDCPYKDIGLGFSLRETEKTYVSVYVMDWNNAVSETKPITVGLYNSIKTTTVFDTAGVDSVDAHYGTALAETTVTTNGTYVTFAIEEAGDYSIVAYYDNPDPTTVTTAPVQAMMTAFFFDLDGIGEEDSGNQGGEETPESNVLLDTRTQSSWEASGYGKDGYLLLGSNSSSAKLAYSDMYTEQGNDGKTEITLYNHGNNYMYYEEKDKTTDATAPISNWVLTGRRTWTVSSASYAYPYIPGTTTQYPVRLHNSFACPYKDIGLGFSLRETEKTYVSVYVMDWNNAVSETKPITVGLYSGIKTTTVFDTAGVDSVDAHYGTALAETTVTTNGTYVTFAIEEAGDYSIVAYYDNQDPTTVTTAPVQAMMTAFFFDKQLPEGLDAKYVAQDTTSKSAWEANGYGKDGYLILGGATSTKNVYTAYSNMYSKLGNDGKTEITAFYKHGNNHLYYNSYQATVDSTAPVSDLAWLGSTWTAIDANSVNNPYLYAPGTTTEYLARVHNGATSPNRDTGFSFTLRNVGKIYVSAYVMEWNNSKALDTNPITVALFKTDALFELPANVDGNIRLVEDYYGTPIAKTTVTTSGAYVTFALKEAGNYSIVAYYDNTDTSVNSPVIPSITGLFFDKDRSPALTSTSLSLEGDIGVNYYFGAQGQDLTGGYMQITYQNGATEQLFIENRNGDGTYKFQVKVAAKDYAVAMTAQLFNAEGVAISEAIEYSPAEYVASIIDAGAGVYGDKLIALVQALDDYGKAAANLFYGESNVLTADFSAVTTSTLEAYQFSVSGSLPAGVKLSDFSLSLKSTTSLKIYFTAKSLDGIVCKVGDTVIEPEATGATNEYCIVIENINAKDLDTNYVVSIGGYQLTLSTLSYSLRALEYSSNASLKTAMQALYLYNQAANAYFEEA